MSLEVIRTRDAFLLLQWNAVSEPKALLICRSTGRITVGSAWQLLASADEPECLGTAEMLVGKFNDNALALVTHCSPIAEHKTSYFAHVYRVERVVCLELARDAANEEAVRSALKPCAKHSSILSPPSSSLRPSRSFGQLEALRSSAIVKMGSKASVNIKNTAGNLASQVRVPFKNRASGSAINSSNNNNVNSSASNAAVERYERRINESFLRLFNEPDSFYFSRTVDLTRPMQQQKRVGGRATSENDTSPEHVQEKQRENQQSQEKLCSAKCADLNWRDANDRFFFNRHLLLDLIELDDKDADFFIVPMVHGYVEQVAVPIDKQNLFYFNNNMTNSGGKDEENKSNNDGLPDLFYLGLISRRSPYRAGTRYKRRGVDSDGHVANYVETEQVLCYSSYSLSFVMTRGSVPLYWSQPGLRYRPPPILDTNANHREALEKHFKREVQIYGRPVHAISLVERAGREKVIADAYEQQMRELDSGDVTYTSFDFHAHCKGLNFDNISILLQALSDRIRSMAYCWQDREGVVCNQKGVFRVNCIDCLDRTNVVQTAIARIVLERQLAKLGLLGPEQGIDDNTKSAFQTLWADNGDALSRQYAGTSALKGDFTRTGERNLSGVVKDGVNSANRYFVNQFRDEIRQAAIDIVTNQNVNDDLVLLKTPGEPSKSIEETVDECEQVSTILEDSKRLLLSDPEQVLGAWLLQQTDTTSELLDTVLLLLPNEYIVASYNEMLDKVTDFLCIDLKDVEAIHLGPYNSSNNNVFLAVLPFGSNNEQQESNCLRISYRMMNKDGVKESGFFHTFRAPGFLFFNNMVEAVNSEEERYASLSLVADAFKCAIDILGGNKLVFVVGERLERRRSRVPFGNNEDSKAKTRTDLLTRALKSSGQRALQNMSSHFSRLNPVNKVTMLVQGNKSDNGNDNKSDRFDSDNEANKTDEESNDDENTHKSRTQVLLL